MNELSSLGMVLLAVGVILAIGVSLFLLDRLLLWMERRGWVYWRKTTRSTGPGMGNALLEMQSLVEPAARHALEIRRQVQEESPEPGDPPSDEEGDDRIA